jgi:hypothetical protein
MEQPSGTGLVFSAWKRPGAEALEFCVFIQGPEDPCSLRKNKQKQQHSSIVKACRDIEMRLP